MKIKLLYLFSVILFLVTLPLFVFAGNIVYPWRAVSTFVKSGESFHILYNNVSSLPIDSVILVGPFNKVTLNIDSVNIGRFKYDTYTQYDVNNEIWVNVPEFTPEELYDLQIHSGGQVHLSPKSVKVVIQYNQTHSFIHISDLHISRQWVGTAEDGYAKELELFDRFVEVANIISPDFILITGDNIHHYTMVDADATGWDGKKIYEAHERPLVEEKYKNFFYGAKEFSGLYGLNAPTFNATGNHDSYGVPRNDPYAKSTQWNNMMGKRVYGFSYAGTRIIVADDYLGDPVTDIPDNAPMSGLQGKLLNSFLNKKGAGSLRIMAQHRHDRIDTTFINNNKINILLNGHNHFPSQEYVGSTPTLSIRSGTVCRSGEIRRWEETLGFFRIFYIDDDTFEYTPPLRFCKNPTVHYKDLELNITLDFHKPNNGSSVNNKAIIRNFFSVDLPKCKVRFVMKKGEYEVSGGTIHQVIQTDNLSVVDVYTNVDSNDIAIVNIHELK